MQYELSYYIGKYRAWILGVTIAFIVSISGLVIYFQWQQANLHKGKIAVPIEVVPRDATVKLASGEVLDSRGTVWLAPNTYQVTVSREGFDSHTSSLRVSEDATPYIYVALAGKSNEAKKWQNSNRADYSRLELLTIQKSREYNTRFKSNNPIVGILPIKDPYYTIDYRNHDDATIELIIYGTSPRYRKAAVDFLHSKGYDPTDYRVTYEGFVNPLGASRE